MITYMAKVTMAAPLSAFSGRIENLVFVASEQGATVRTRVIPANPRTPAQVAWRAAMKEAGQAYRKLNAEQFRLWRLYASGQNVAAAFMGLAARVVWLDPAAPIPMVPPDSPFSGDGIVVAPSSVSGGVLFTASAPNAAGVVTELLVQPLTSPFNSAPLSKYRSKGVAAFASGSLSSLVTLRPGHWACAVRFVRKATGQSSPVLPIGVVTVSA